MSETAKLRPDMTQACADLRELTDLSRRFWVDLVGCIKSLTERDHPVFCGEVDAVPAAGTDYLLCRFKLHERLEGALAALRARNSDFDAFHEVSPEMMEAGSLVLSRIKDDVAEGTVSLRDAVQLIYRAMRTALASSGSGPTLPFRF